MYRKSFFALFFLFCSLFFSPSILSASNMTQLKIVTEFMEAYLHNDLEGMRSLSVSSVGIPHFLQNSKVNLFTGYPSTRKDTTLVVANYENEPDRIAFIWELHVTNHKIDDLYVVYDGIIPEDVIPN
jgi:hypothetical protein